MALRLSMPLAELFQACCQQTDGQKTGKAGAFWCDPGQHGEHAEAHGGHGEGAGY